MKKKALKSLKKKLSGTLFYDDLHKSLYATDASVYRKIPTAVAYPKNKKDIQILIEFARQNRTSLIPRTAGTSLAGQCVGPGVVVDVSKSLNRIITFDQLNKTITVEPGVIRDDLNAFLKPYKLFFGPNTSTSNRCTIGGMVGNNSSGSTSIRYGVTRDKVLRIDGFLSDGSAVSFHELTSEQLIEKTKAPTLEGKIYKSIVDELLKKEVQQEIKKEFPKPSIHRRNTGYAIDSFLTSNLFGGSQPKVNPAKLLAGSEGTLVFFTAITLQLDVIPPKKKIIVASHFKDINESLKATVLAMKHELYACELMDQVILDCTKNNREQSKNRFFIQGEPKAILMLEVSADAQEEVDKKASALVEDLERKNYGYHHAILQGNDLEKIVAVRKAGLGLLGNMIGDKKAVACIEDTAVNLEDLPSYIDEFTKIMLKYRQKAVYYAHAGAGELHLRPILNLKKLEEVSLFRKLTTETAQLVKKYGGSFSGEHGDGIVRSEFIPLMIGQTNYQLLRRIKNAFDPYTIFNQGKIIDAFPMDQNLRYEIDRNEPEIVTIQDFTSSQGILRLAEQCNGSGDCRKSTSAGGVMCPSYRATKNEKDSTRARANALREFLTNSNGQNGFDHQELKEVFDLCLSCKACAAECPSNVDVAALKSEFLYQYQEKNGYPFRDKLIANNTKYNKIGSLFPNLTNWIINTSLMKLIMGISLQRKIPPLATETLKVWYRKQRQSSNKRTVYLFCDEFTNFYETEIGKDAIRVLKKLGYQPRLIDHFESGRSFISKGFLKEAKKLANKNISLFKTIISRETPLIGIEPSAILSFRDEYIRLADNSEAAKNVSRNTFTIEEFLKSEFEKGRITTDQFSSEERLLKIHGHCHQKALSSTLATFSMLNIPKNYHPTIMNTGCCGMAGAFGYEKKHYEISMQIGENSLFPKVRNALKTISIVSSGTSCRQQIYDGTGRIAKHPITILREALL